MRIILLSVLIVVSVSAISAQTHQQAVNEFANLEQRIEAVKKEAERLEQTIIQPDKEDLVVAAKENVNVFRIWPREKYDKDYFKVRGGGAFYSFTNQSHSYDEIPQISLEQNYL